MLESTHKRLTKFLEENDYFDYANHSYDTLDDWTPDFYTYMNVNTAGLYLLYIGQMSTDLKRKHGFGIRINMNGQFEEGFWINEKQYGEGRWYFKLGSYYRGNFEDSLKHGYGRYVGHNGDRYNGYYAEDLRHAEGLKILGEGIKLYGKFDDTIDQEY